MKAKKSPKPAKKASAPALGFPPLTSELPIWVRQTALAAVRNETPDLPDWVAETPNIEFQLALFVDSDQREFISLSRDEYVYLKHMLAKMRGYAVPKAA